MTKTKLTTTADGSVYGPNGTPLGKVKTTGKKSGGKTSKKVTPGRVRTVGDQTLSVGERRLKVVKVMKKMGATSATTAVTPSVLATKTGLTRFDTCGQLYHTHYLQVNGYVKQVSIEGSREAGYHLTKKGTEAADTDIIG